jgi:Putative peptidoglycan-binding domain-containing protein
MRKIKSIAIGLLTTFIFSSSAGVLGISAASLPATKVSTPTISASSVSDNNSINMNSVISNTVVTPEFNYGPMGGPDLDTIIKVDGGVVQEGDVGYAVYQLQGILNDYSYFTGYRLISQDGYFGSDTYGAVIAFQNWCKIPADGIVGRQTLEALC